MILILFYSFTFLIMQYKIYSTYYENGSLISKHFEISVKTKREAKDFFLKQKEYIEKKWKCLFHKTNALIGPYIFLENFKTEVSKELLKISEWIFDIKYLILEVL